MNKLNLSFFNGALKPLSVTVPQHAKTTNTIHFNAIINRLASQGSHHHVLLTFSSMLQNNTPPDTHTFPSLLKACTYLDRFPLGLSFHQCVIVNGFSSDSYIASSLINFYAKFGCVRHARKVFDTMPVRNVVPWTSIIGCYSRACDFDQALLLFSEMRRHQIQPNPITLLSMLPIASELTYVKCFHGCSISYGFECDVTLMNSILSVYGKCGGIEEGRKVFEHMTRRDIVSWNSLLSSYSQNGNVREVFHLLNKMRAQGIEPDKQTFGPVVFVAATQSNLRLGKLVHGKILRNGFELDSHVETLILVMYMKCRSIDTAFQIFKRIQNKDVVLWTAMISGLVQNDCADGALTVFSQMLKSRIEPSTATVASAVAACAKLGSLDMGTSIHCYVLRQGMTLDIPAQNSLVTMYAKCGHLQQSRVVFERMSKRDLVSWNAIVAGYAQNGHLCEGLFLLSEMRTTLQKPDSLTVVSLLQACASIGALHQGKWIHNFVIRSCIRPCILVDTALVDMYSKCGDLKNAKKCFNEMSEQDMVSWGTIISGYGCHGEGKTALKMYSEFLRTGIQPNNVIFLSVLSACSHNGLVDQGLSIYQSMTEDFGIAPNLEHRACIVDLLSRAGRVKEAYKFYGQEFAEPAVEVLGILLDACRKNGNVELGEVIARHLLTLRPMDSGNYVQLAHSFASMNRWEGVGETWAQMRSLGLKKLPGWSFIELHGTIETFYTSHNSHPRLEDIVSTLKALRMEMRKLRH
ncbi:pentatricopeptide repeat-containing protein At4g04370 [Humulus lupulus]|uniref:pentatricopeptide repeat-containing protein At4g04370 n=1 Tax=Humulus lupulus TaxID=3486 RepID=UPI002B40D65B|nr:pentatricopeptide repeat-containing protein At4g04370 [Humulus lupulus]XP_062088293.1 pentatricopeptide repeat-containing protein At4g04370 [Humulus lupulus]XP_062088294.1 pentatricopeptide repeat-containing protein At4g04370 [Humulus lupulus]XP_062088295.1 pentatricopeptide repeat-containing protein At4g04370 [Humulus lupulus]